MCAEEQIKQREQSLAMERDSEVTLARQLEVTEGSQWGKPGPGGAYWRDSALTGQGFFEKMGWHASSDPRKREDTVRRNEADSYKQDMSEAQRRRLAENRDINSDVGLELAPLLLAQPTGKPRRDPSTGYLMSHSLSTTDVTQLASQAG